MTIELESVSFSYPARGYIPAPVVSGLTLSVTPGECVGITGPEGAGKSTILQLIIGLLRPAEGRVCADGVDLWADPRRLPAFRRKAGLAFQFPEQQFLCSSIRDELLYTARRYGVPDPLDPAAALGAFGLDFAAMADRSPFLLSVGEARRVALASLLVHRPGILLLDEPTSGLDAGGVRDVIRVVRDLRAEGRTIVIVSHDLDFLAEVVSRVVLVQNGRVVHDGRACEVLGGEALLGRIGFPLPETVQAARRLGILHADAGRCPPIRLEELREAVSRRRQEAAGGSGLH